jgi:hypothetical protein
VGRIGKQCRERYFNHLDPSIKKSEWTPEEDQILEQSQARIGNKWCEIAKLLPGRSENSVKNRWNSAMRRKRHAERLKAQGASEDVVREAARVPRSKASGKRKSSGPPTPSGTSRRGEGWSRRSASVTASEDDDDATADDDDATGDDEYDEEDDAGAALGEEEEHGVVEEPEAPAEAAGGGPTASIYGVPVGYSSERERALIAPSPVESDGHSSNDGDLHAVPMARGQSTGSLKRGRERTSAPFSFSGGVAAVLSGDESASSGRTKLRVNRRSSGNANRRLGSTTEWPSPSRGPIEQQPPPAFGTPTPAALPQSSPDTGGSMAPQSEAYHSATLITGLPLGLGDESLDASVETLSALNDPKRMRQGGLSLSFSADNHGGVFPTTAFPPGGIRFELPPPNTAQDAMFAAANAAFVLAGGEMKTPSTHGTPGSKGTPEFLSPVSSMPPLAGGERSSLSTASALVTLHNLPSNGQPKPTLTAAPAIAAAGVSGAFNLAQGGPSPGHTLSSAEESSSSGFRSGGHKTDGVIGSTGPPRTLPPEMAVEPSLSTLRALHWHTAADHSDAAVDAFGGHISGMEGSHHLSTASDSPPSAGGGQIDNKGLMAVFTTHPQMMEALRMATTIVTRNHIATAAANAGIPSPLAGQAAMAVLGVRQTTDGVSEVTPAPEGVTPSSMEKLRSQLTPACLHRIQELTVSHVTSRAIALVQASGETVVVSRGGGLSTEAVNVLVGALTTTVAALARRAGEMDTEPTDERSAPVAPPAPAVEPPPPPRAWDAPSEFPQLEGSLSDVDMGGLGGLSAGDMVLRRDLPDESELSFSFAELSIDEEPRQASSSSMAASSSSARVLSDMGPPGSVRTRTVSQLSDGAKRLIGVA